MLALALAGGLAAAAPVLSSVTPGNAPSAGGTSITLTGSSFGTSGVSVSIGGQIATITSLANTQAVVTLPPGQGANQSVILTNATTGASNSKPFNYDAPVITELSPGNISTAGGSLITLTGTSFGTTPTVTFGGVSMPVNSRSHTQIVATVPAGQGGSKQVIVTAGGQSSPAAISSYSNPSITSITPSSLNTNGTTAITLTGTNFGSLPAQTALTIGGVQATISSLSHTSIIATAPAGQGASLPVGLTVSGLSAAVTQVISYTAPFIDSISPSSFPTAGGTLVTLTGTNFGLTPSATFGSITLQPTSSTHTSAVFAVPAGQGLNQSLQLTVGQQTSNTVLYNYDAPGITSVSPTSAPTSGNTPITITGNNFGLSGTVSIGGASVTPTSYSHTQIIANVPPGQGGTVNVSVTSAGRTSNTSTISYQPPNITSISAGNVSTAGGSVITLTGTNFGTSPIVLIGGNPATVSTSTHTSAIVVVPVGQGTNKTVQLIAGGISATSSLSYSPPSISSLSYASAPTSGGTLITLNGANFGGILASTSASLNGAVVTVDSVSHSKLVLQLPAGSGSNLPLTVTVSGQISNTTQFSYEPPAIDSIIASSLPTAGATSITLTGKNFGTSPSATFGPSSGQLVTANHTSATFLLPAGQGVNQQIIITADTLSSAPALFSYDPPVLSSITPTSAPTSGNTVITLTGSNFGLNGSVAVGTTSATVNSWTHTQITATLPPGQGASLPVVVTNGTRSSNSRSFSYNPPSLGTMSVSSGPTAGGTVITLTGSNFGPSPIVRFGAGTLNPLPGSASHTSLVFTLPPGEGSAAVGIDAGGQLSNTLNFSYDAPLLSDISAGSLPTAGGTVITLNGSNFGLTASVQLDGASVPVDTRSHTAITCTLPAGEGLNRQLRVTVAGTPSNPLPLSYDAPVLTGISAGSMPTSGGTLITLTGRNFGLSPAASLDGVTITRSGTFTHTSATFLLPAGQGTGLGLTLSAGGQNSNSLPLNYDAPGISSLSLARAPTAGNIPITIYGSNFGLNGIVKVGQASATIGSYSHNLIVATVPPGQGANPGITVISGEQSSPSYAFGYNAPVLLSLSASSGPVAGNIPITIHGSDFGTSPQVMVGTSPAPVSAAASTHSRIVCTLPAGTGRDKPVVVIVGGQSSNSLAFSYLPHDYDTWLQSLQLNGLPTSPTADPRSCGWPNLLSYALGVDPLTANGGEIAQRSPARFGKPSIRRNAMGQLEVGFWRRNASQGSDLQYQVQFASGLGSGDWQTSTATPQIEQVDEVWDYCTVTDNAPPGTVRFGRVKVVKSAQ